MRGDTDSRDTYEAARVDQARFVLANQSDIENTNVTLTVREVAPDVPIAATVSDDESQDILELSGATHVLPLKRWLGQQLAARINAHHAELHPIGQYRDLRFAELPVHNTPLAGCTIREAGLRESMGVSIVGVWERGTFHPATPSRRLSDSSVPVVVGTPEQLKTLNERLASYDVNENPVLVIGGGTVGQAAIQTLTQRDVPVHLVERDATRCEVLRPHCDAVFQGDASEYRLLREAGIEETPSVLLTTNDDAVNIYLASYCRRLNPDLRIVSRITHERNLEAIHRAGADFVLSSTKLGVEAVYSALKNKRLVILGEGVDLFPRDVPPSLQDRTLADSEIGARTGLSVIAIEQNGSFRTDLSADTTLPPDGRLVMIGTEPQTEAFVDAFE
jgi:Trk K+ transport system NAD-binding subunit